ncbi:hypothetical protein AOLI_G00239140 [Acnodon oligacanthus]
MSAIRKDRPLDALPRLTQERAQRTNWRRESRRAVDPESGQSSTSGGTNLINHGWTRRWNTAPVHWYCQVLQCVHHHRKEELRVGHICQHCCHYPLLQAEAQEAEGGDGKLIYRCLVIPLVVFC